MPKHHIGEIPAQDISDIEENKISRKCPICKHRQDKRVKILTVTTMYGETTRIKTKNFMGVCTNRACNRYSNPKSIPSWILDDATIKA